MCLKTLKISNKIETEVLIEYSGYLYNNTVDTEQFGTNASWLNFEHERFKSFRVQK